LRTALLYLTHTWSPALDREFAELSAIEFVDAWILSDSRNPSLPELRRKYPACHVFSLSSLFDLPYSRISTGNLQGHGHFPPLEFYLEHPEYDGYWIIEYDVRYTGCWADLLARYEAFPHDLIASHIRTFAEEPDWFWWDSFGHAELPIAPEFRIRSFNVIYRISSRALRFLDSELRKGWRGHHEVLIATLLHRNGYGLLDFGGDGAFARPEFRNMAYISSAGSDGSLSNGVGTICYRPVREEPGPWANKLYHPIKTDC
jgi:hypothetical protein